MVLASLTNEASPNFDNCYHLIESALPRPGPDPYRHSIISASFSLQPK